MVGIKVILVDITPLGASTIPLSFQFKYNMVGSAIYY